MTEAQQRVIEIEDLEKQLAELKSEIAETKADGEVKRENDFCKIKEALDQNARDIISTVKPYIEKYQEAGNNAANCAKEKIEENPLLAAAIALGTGVALGVVLSRLVSRD